jgi:hypothetical protein
VNNSTPTQPETKEIPLSNGMVAIVDAADYDFLMQWKWHICGGKRERTWYAARNAPISRGKQIQTRVMMHREILGAEPGTRIDHIDGDGLNNTRKNLRFCTHQQNLCNRPAQINNTSGYKGVYWHKRASKWVAQISENGKRKYLGRFANAEDAAHAYDAAAKELYGEFARLNFPYG